MYQAELCGKLSSKKEYSEDVLTSNIFSLFKYDDRRKYLKDFLSVLNLQPSDSELNNAEFLFWHNYDNKTQPDVIMLVGNKYLLFEAKYFSLESNEQMKREIESGITEAKSMKMEFYYVAINKDYSFNQSKFEYATKTLNDKFCWFNWQCVNSIIVKYINDGQASLMATDLYELLLRRWYVHLKILNSILQ